MNPISPGKWLRKVTGRFGQQAEDRSDNPRKDERFRLMKAHFLQHVGPSRLRGLEVGAFDLPLIEPAEGRCDFADYHATDELKRMAGELNGTNAEFVVPVTYVTAEGYDAVPKDYDWVAACHVIEHMADFIGWLRTIAEHLKPEGTLFLGIPDKRYTFDVHRRLTTLSDAIACHEAKLTWPSFYQVFDFFYFHAGDVVPSDVWAGKAAPPPARDFAKSIEAARQAATQYYDVHCSVFTPDSFTALIRDAIDAKLIPYKLISVRPTARKMLDFSAVLRRAPA